MKIKSISKNENTCDIVRNNPNTVGTHLCITSGRLTDDKKDYSNIVLLSLVHERGFLKSTFEETVEESQSFIDSYEKRDVKGL